MAEYGKKTQVKVALGLVLMLSFGTARASAYSVLAHEATIDVCWDGVLEPFLLQRFPHTSSQQLLRARSFAYGGSVIQDLGYYPFGNKFFSNLAHYVRSGDFIETLIREARDADELAFALGALAHYENDTTGHPDAVNLAVPMVFPKLRQKFGERITYVQAPHQHVIVEFSFDIVQVAGGAYAPDAFRRLIGFRVATPLLERVFRATYGLEMSDVFADTERALSTYRYAVSQIIPAITEAAWRDKRDEIVRLAPTLDRSAFVFAYPRRDFETDYGRNYQKPAFFARVLAVLYRIVPKIGPLKPLAFKAPTAEAETLFANSFREATSRFRTAVLDLRDSKFNFNNVNFDTGQSPRHGEYALADDTYAELVEHICRRRCAETPAALTRNILEFYRDPSLQRSQSTKYERKHWAELVDNLSRLSRTPVAD